MSKSKNELAEIKADMDRGDRLHALKEELKTLKKQAFYAYFRLGEIMKEVRDDELWRESYESFEAFCADDELGFSFSHVKNAIVTFERYPKPKELDDIPYSKLVAIGPYLDEGDREELIKMARSLSRSDLQHQLKLMRLSQSEAREVYLPKIYPCAVCGKVKGVGFEQLCHCGWTPKQVEYVSKLIEKVDNQEYEI